MWYLQCTNVENYYGLIFIQTFIRILSSLMASISLIFLFYIIFIIFLLTHFLFLNMNLNFLLVIKIKVGLYFKHILSAKKHKNN